MTKQTRIGIAAATFAALFALVDTGGTEECVPDRIPLGTEAPVKEPPITVSSDLHTNVKNIASLLKRDKEADAKKLAAEAARSLNSQDLTRLYGPRYKGGIGWGSMRKPFPNPKIDSLLGAVFIFELPGVPRDYLADAVSHEEAAYSLAAIAELTLAIAPKKDMAYGKTVKTWIDSAAGMRKASIELARAAVARNEKRMEAAANEVIDCCVNCHVKFKE